VRVSIAAMLLPALASAHDHRGLFLRFALGPGYATASSNTDESLSGAAIALSAAVGIAVGDRWAAYVSGRSPRSARARGAGAVR
jgi:hypothetical protein